MDPQGLAGADLLVGLALAGAAAAVLVPKRRHPVGLLLALAAAAWWLGDLSPYLLYLHRGPMVHLHLSYPTGRLHRRPARVAVVGAYGWAFAEAWQNTPAVTAVVALAVALAAYDTHARTSGPARRAGLPGLMAALLFASVLGLSAANQLLSWEGDTAVAFLYDAVMLAIPSWLAYDLLRGGWTDATLAQLITQLGQPTSSTGLEAELRAALGDPTLRVGYATGAGGHVDAAGAQLAVGGAAMTHVDQDGTEVAALFHDPALLNDPALLAGAAAAVRLVVSNRQLRNDVKARTSALATARRHLLETGDRQRALLSSELAAGPMHQLDLAERALRGAQTRGHPAKDAPHDALAREAAAAREELSRFARGLRPEGLAAMGLRGVLPRGAVIEVGRLPEATESAIYFICAEALTNATKHARANHVATRVRQVADTVHIEVRDDGVGGADPSGSGLLGLADRVAALGGTLQVISPPGRGTTVLAHIPIDGELP
jgi:signal transduction histidine kinase